MMTRERLEEIRESSGITDDPGTWNTEVVEELIAEVERQDAVIGQLKEALKQARIESLPESACADECENVSRGVDEDFPG